MAGPEHRSDLNERVLETFYTYLKYVYVKLGLYLCLLCVDMGATKRDRCVGDKIMCTSANSFFYNLAAIRFLFYNCIFHSSIVYPSKCVLVFRANSGPIIRFNRLKSLHSRELPPVEGHMFLIGRSMDFKKRLVKPLILPCKFLFSLDKSDVRLKCCRSIPK